MVYAMTRYDVVVLPIARDDIGEVYLYIAADNPTAATTPITRILDHVDALSKFPLSGGIVPDRELAKREYRMLAIGKYLVFYRVIEERVVVYRVLHGARYYPDLLM